MSEVAILIPVLRRPWRAAPLVENIHDATPEPHSIVFLSTLGDDAEIDAVHAVAKNDESVVLYVLPPNRFGDYAVKINFGYRTSSTPHVFLGADDLRFHPGWFPAALAQMSETVGVVGTQDLGQPRVLAGEHSTHSLVARWYVEKYGTVDESGKVLHEGYPHEFVDDEFIGTAKVRGAFAFAHDSVVEHMHPHWGKGEWDDLYRDEPRRMVQGRRLYRQRRLLWERRAR